MYARLNNFLLSARGIKDRFLSPAVLKFPCWITPNTFTSVRFLIAIFLGLLCFLPDKSLLKNWNLNISICFFLIALGFVTDLWDGSIARVKNMVSVSGSFYDAATDKIIAMPAAILTSYFFPALFTSMMFLYFYKSLMLVLILVKLGCLNYNTGYIVLQKIYSAINVSGYLLLFYFITMDLVWKI